MRVRLFSPLLAILFVPTLAHADAHKADLFGGASGGGGGSGVGGFEESLAWSFGACRWCNVVLPDVSVQFGGHEGKDLTQVTYQFGFRATLTTLMVKSDTTRSADTPMDTPLKVFVQGLTGWAYTNDGTSAAGNNGVFTIGGGVQWLPHTGKVIRDGNSRTYYGGLGIQGQVDYIIRADRQSFVRVSGGVVYRFLDPERVSKSK